jgi:hypothetical protein
MSEQDLNAELKRLKAELARLYHLKPTPEEINAWCFRQKKPHP